MECREAQPKLADLAVEALAETDAREVRAHVESCPDCARELAELHAVGNALDATRPVAPSPETWARIAPRLRPRRPRWALIAAPAAAAAVLAVALVLPHYLTPGPSPAPSPPVAGSVGYDIVSLDGDEDYLVTDWYARGGLSADPAARALLLDHLDHTHAAQPDGGDAE